MQIITASHQCLCETEVLLFLLTFTVCLPGTVVDREIMAWQVVLSRVRES